MTFDSLGEPSCALVWLTVGTLYNKALAFGSSSTYCLNLYPSVSFMSVYNKSNHFLTINMIMEMKGLVNINFLIKNDYESLKLTKIVTVSSLKCQKPILDIKNRAIDFLNPRVIERSKRISVIGVTILNCSVTLKNSKQWSIFEINPNNGSTIRLINVTNIISLFSSEIYIPSNFFSYGTYKFIYEVCMEGDDASSFKETIDTYIRIVPTGMVIFAFSGGIKEITIGIGQSVDLNPGRYSYDLDRILTGTDLSYKFYCRVLIDEVPQMFPSDYSGSYIDLWKIKNENLSTEIIQTKLCFVNSGSSILFF